MPTISQLSAKDTQLGEHHRQAVSKLHKVKHALLQQTSIEESLKTRWTHITQQVKKIRGMARNAVVPQHRFHSIRHAQSDLEKVKTELLASQGQIKKLRQEEAAAFTKVTTVDYQQKKVSELLQTAHAENHGRLQNQEEAALCEQLFRPYDIDFSSSPLPETVVTPEGSFVSERSGSAPSQDLPEPSHEKEPENSSEKNTSKFTDYQDGHSRIDLNFQDSVGGRISIGVESHHSELKVVCTIDDALMRSRLREKLKRTLDHSGISVSQLTVRK